MEYTTAFGAERKLGSEVVGFRFAPKSAICTSRKKRVFDAELPFD